MSTPAGSGIAEGKSGDRRMSLGKYVKRMSSVFKREKSSKTGTGSEVAASGAPSVIEPRTQQQSLPTTEGLATQAEAASAIPPTTTTTTTETPAAADATAAMPTTVTKQLDRHAMQQERARALFAKYGLTLDSHDWIPAPSPMPTVQRVEKSIRMRVHRSCHRCGTLYGSEKTCLQCEHKRCKKCPRYPKKRLPVGEKETVVPPEEKPRKKRVLTVTTRGGNELAYQPSKQRVRRTCHKCQTVFIPSTATVCEQCRHVRCTRCPREPAKLQKWPAGYPGDMEADSDSEVEKQLEKFRRTWRKPRQRVRWECEHCQTAFINASPQCPGCGHERCDKCVRSPFKKTKREETFDPQLVAAVEAKLRALDVDSDMTTSGLEAVR